MSDAYQAIVDLSHDYITLIDAGYRYCLVNNSYCLQIGREKEQVLGRTVADVWGEQRFSEIIRPKIDACLSGQDIEYLDTFRFGTLEKHVRVRLHPYRESGDEITHVLVFSQDVTVQSETAARLAEFEHRDRLTGLYNRKTFEITLEQQLSQASRMQAPCLRVLLFLSMRNFKNINRTYGHQIGDVLLENTALRVSETVRSSDFVFRFDGTNFVVLLSDIERGADAAVPAEKICEAVSLPYRFEAGEIAIGVHIGIAVFPDDARDGNELLQRANSASVEAEDRGLPYLFYDTELHEKAIQRSLMYSQLRQAFEHEQFRLMFQPLVRIDQDPPVVIGAEALVRWEHPQRGLLPPGDFLRLAEETHLIKSVDKWVLFTICAALTELQQSFPEVVLSANMSALGFLDPELPNIIEAALRAAGNPKAEGLRIELTESMSVQQNPAGLAERVCALESLGVQVWIDDFGVGQSSLALLKALPAHGIKIDKSFVEGVADSAQEQRYLAGIVAGIRARNKAIVVEGISGAGELRVVQELGCEIGQGYYFGRPLPIEELHQLLGRHI